MPRRILLWAEDLCSERRFVLLDLGVDRIALERDKLQSMHVRFTNRRFVVQDLRCVAVRQFARHLGLRDGLVDSATEMRAIPQRPVLPAELLALHSATVFTLF